jgi:hypothetical protein
MLAGLSIHFQPYYGLMGVKDGEKMCSVEVAHEIEGKIERNEQVARPA